MIKSITVINHLGEDIKLELTRPDKSGFIIKSIDGLGPVKATINTTKVATVDGELYNSAYLDKRSIVMTLQFLDSANESIEDIRHKSYKYFPIKKNVRLIIETDKRTVEARGYVEANEPSIFSATEGCSITVLCTDPFLYSSYTNTTVFSGVQALFEFPLENDSLTEPLLEFGSIENKTEYFVKYEGDIDVGITIKIHAIGDASNITIHNLSTREQMRIDTSRMANLLGTDYGIIAGDTIIIDTNVGNKSIILLRDGVETNILNCLDKRTDWFKISKGDNVFAYVAESGSENLQFRISNKIVYEGV